MEDDIDPTRRTLPVAKKGPDGLYVVKKDRCLCDHAQGPCFYHATYVRSDTRAPVTRQLTLW